MTDSVLQFFSEHDPVINNLYNEVRELENFGIPAKSSPDEYYLKLTRSIASQQLNIKVADIIWQRVVKLISDNFTPEMLLKVNPEELRACGLSYSKINYMQSIAQSFLDNKNIYLNLDNLQNDQIIEELTKIRGVGVWTAEMFLIFTLAREDVFSVLDLGLRKAVSWHYTVDIKDKTAIELISQKWSPYRSYASLILWKSLELT